MDGGVPIRRYARAARRHAGSPCRGGGRNARGHRRPGPDRDLRLGGPASGARARGRAAVGGAERRRRAPLEHLGSPSVVSAAAMEAAERDRLLQRIAPDVKLGRGVRLHGFVNLYGCEIGDETSIGTFVEIQKGAKIGARCKIQSHTFVCEGVTIEDEVFVGHNVNFLNDRYPAATTDDGKPKTEKRSEEHTSELQSPCNLVCRLLLEKKKRRTYNARPPRWHADHALQSDTYNSC